MKKPTPDEVVKLRDAMPEGCPRLDYREMDLRPVVREKVDGEEESAEEDPNAPVRVAISSEAPVLRYDWWKEERYYEVLDHSEKSVDLSYSRDGLPFVASHRAHDADQQHGIAENVRVEGKQLVADLRMSRAVRSQEIAQDIKDGIRKKVSVGYIVGDDYEQTEGRDGIPTRRYKNWMPLEVSTVPIPADYSVGIGRALTPATQEAMHRFLTLHPSQQAPKKAEERTMSDQDKAPAGAAPSVQVNERANEEAAKRIENITNLAVAHGIESAKLTDWIRSGASVSDVTGQINTILTERMKKPIETSRGVELSEKEFKKFSYARALMLDGDVSKMLGGERVDTGFEREVVEEARKRTPMATGKGIFIPFVTQRAGITGSVDTSTASTGGPFKFTAGGDFIDLLRNRSSVMRAGATVLTGLTGPVTFPKQLTAATGSWVAENPGSDLARTAITTGTVSLAFKTVQAASAVSRQALFSAASGNYDLEQIIRGDLAQVIALAVDLGGLNGLGSSNQPLGLLQDTAVGTATALGANGGTISWAAVVGLETAIGNANADGGTLAYITNTKQRGQAKQVAVLGNTVSGVPIWTGQPGTMDGMVNGYRAFASNQVPSNLTKGTATTVCSAWVFGDFSQLMIGTFGAGFEVMVDPYTLKLQNLIDLTAWTFVDVANRYPVAFATIKDAL